MSETWDLGPLFALLDRTAALLEDVLAFLDADDDDPEVREELALRLENTIQELADMNSIQSDYV